MQASNMGLPSAPPVGSATLHQPGLYVWLQICSKVSAFSLFGAGVGQDREDNFLFNFHDSYLKGIVEEKVQLAKDLGLPI